MRSPVKNRVTELMVSALNFLCNCFGLLQQAAWSGAQLCLKCLGASAWQNLVSDERLAHPDKATERCARQEILDRSLKFKRSRYFFRRTTAFRSTKLPRTVCPIKQSNISLTLISFSTIVSRRSIATKVVLLRIVFSLVPAIITCCRA